MTRTHYTKLVLASATFACTGFSFAESSDQQRIEALENRITELQRTVDSLRASGGDWLTATRAEEIRTIVHDVLADADTRASLLQNGMTAGWDNGFFIGDTDGKFHLKMKGQLQFRFMLNSQDNTGDASGDDNRWGFENTRTKLRFTGHVVDPSWIYMIEGNFDRSGSGNFGLEDAYLGKVLGDSGWTFLAGQFKVPMLREELVYSAHQQAVERSLVNEEFTAGRTQGVCLWYRDDTFDLWLGYTDGHPASGGFNMPALAADTEISLTARAAVLLDGSWEQFDDLPSFPDDEFGLMIGGAAHYQEGEFGTAADELEVFQWTVDGAAEFGGANLFAYFVARHLDSDTVDLDQFGFVVQGGYFLNKDWEVIGRYEWADDDMSDELNIATAGVNRYFSGHLLKWQTDVGYAFDQVTSTFGDGFLGNGGSITGWRADGADEDGQVVVRTQLQLLF